MKSSQTKPVPPEFRPDEAELARQLLALRRPPSSSLQRRIQAIPQPEPQPARLVPRHVVGGLVALLAVVVLLFISPPVQATLDEVQKMMGQIQVSIRSVWPQPGATVVILETEPMTLAEARARLPFEFALPGHLPGSLARRGDEVLVAQAPVAMIKMEWRDTEGGIVQLSIRAAGSENQLNQTLVGPESSQTISLNGREAVLVRGGWDEQSRTWSHQAQVTTLIWTAKGVQYRLLSYSDVVSLPELIKMAESIK